MQPTNLAPPKRQRRPIEQRFLDPAPAWSRFLTVFEPPVADATAVLAEAHLDYEAHIMEQEPVGWVTTGPHVNAVPTQALVRTPFADAPELFVTSSPDAAGYTPETERQNAEIAAVLARYGDRAPVVAAGHSPLSVDRRTMIGAFAHWVLDLDTGELASAPLRHYLLIREPKVSNYTMLLQYMPLWVPEQATLVFPNELVVDGQAVLSGYALRRTTEWRVELATALDGFLTEARYGFPAQARLLRALGAQKLRINAQAREILMATYRRQELPARFRAKLQMGLSLLTDERKQADRVLRQQVMVERYIDDAAMPTYARISSQHPPIANTALALFLAVCAAEDTRWGKLPAAVGFDALYSLTERAATKLRVLEHLVAQLR
jgi:hypothetical protein